jgi:hypothetical protein
MRLTMNLRVLMLALTVLSVTSSSYADDPAHDRKAAAQQLAKQLSQLKIQRLYVPDFVDNSGARTEAAAFMAASFSKLLKDQKKTFTLVSRAEAHEFLQKNEWIDLDLSRSEVFAKFVSIFSPDAILWGTASSTDAVSVTILDVRDASGKSLIYSQYSEPLAPYENLIHPPVPTADRHNFYFAGFDGVSLPKCAHCPEPSIPDAKRSKKYMGALLVLALVTAEGNLDQFRVLKALDPEIDKEAMEKMKGWHLVPAKSLEGKPVPVRVPFEISYHLNN